MGKSVQRRRSHQVASVAVVAIVVDSQTNVLKHGGGVQQLLFSLTVPVQRSQTLEHLARQPAHLIDVLFGLSVVAQDILHAESGDEGFTESSKEVDS